MITDRFLILALMIFGGMAMGRVAKLCRLPNVTGYLVAGLILGPSLLGVIPADFSSDINVISNAALGFIAFSIGSEFKLSYFKRVGITPIIIAIFESLFAVLFVFAALLITGSSLPFAIVLSSIAAATAPAATIMVIKQYKAKGPVSETLLSVVAIDDAVALILFGISVAIAQIFVNPAEVSLFSSIAKPLIEIIGALVCGFALGLLFTIPLRWFKKSSNRIALTVAFIFIGIGIADVFNFSSLLLTMALGAAVANISNESESIMKLTDAITPPIFVLFFVGSGAELQLSVIPTIGMVGILYIVFRFAGKWAGASFGSALCKADKNITKYLGLALMPQAGVAIGLSLVATQVMPEHGATIRAVILCGTLIYELLGPAVAKFSLKKAGEIAKT